MEVGWGGWERGGWVGELVDGWVERLGGWGRWVYVLVGERWMGGWAS